jgi:hypothetical protein
MHASSSSSSSSRTMRFRMTARQSRSGMALLLVLAGVVLITGIAVALLMRVEGGRVMSGAYSKTIEARLLADSVANIVIGQIRDATADGELAWASQPGVIRTYNVTGNFEKGYKLYSSSTMVEDNEDQLVSLDAGNLQGWSNKTGQYVNLNEPVNNHYPILNPGLKNLNIAGFDNLNESNELKNFQMPVEWMYVLKDGTLTTGNYSSGRIVFSGNNAPTDENPIQGRIAFWTDDETAKINVNTAAEGLFWDTPRANTKIADNSANTASRYVVANQTQVHNSSRNPGDNPATDYEHGFAYIQPANKEYNRYPGHPAMNCMSVLLDNSANKLNDPLSKTELEQIFKFASVLKNPEGVLRGSQMGSFQVSPANPTASNVQLGEFPLYATLDETAMVSSLDPASAAQERPETELFDPTDIEMREFLMTASSRAPELNIFNRPRISMWPVHKTETDVYRTGYDSLIAHCGTIRNRDSGQKWPFVFLRENAYSQTVDMANNEALYDYLTGLMDLPLPGWGESFVDKYSTSDCKKLSLQMLDYIRCTNLFDASLEGPDYGTNSTVATSHPPRQFTNGLLPNKVGRPGHGQVLPLLRRNDNIQGLGRAPIITEVALIISATARYEALPGANSNPYNNPARNRTIGAALLPGERRLQCMLLPSLSNPLPGNPNMVPAVFVEVIGLNNLTIGGQQPYAGLTSVLSSTSNALCAQSPVNPTVKGVGTWFGIGGGANLGILPFVAMAIAPARGGVNGSSPLLAADTPLSYSPYDGSSGTITTSLNELMSNFFTVNASNPFTLSSTGNVIIKLYLQGADGKPVGDPYQTYEVPLADLDNGKTVPWPALPNFDQGHGNLQSGIYWWGFSRNPLATNNLGRQVVTHGRLGVVITPGYTPPRPGAFFNYSNSGAAAPFDTILSLHLKDGDYRTIATMPTVTADKWETTTLAPITDPQVNAPILTGVHHTLTQDTVLLDQVPPLTTDARYNIQCNLGNTTHSTYSYFLPGSGALQAYGRLTGPSIVPNIAHLPNVPKSVPDSYNGSTWFGDWDNGMGAQSDGPYSNLPDSGNMYQNPTNLTSINSDPPYFFNPSQELGAGALFFSPNRLVPSSGIFGSISSARASLNEAWRTLLFRPLGTTRGTHPGADTPPDHLLMDWFWMPVVDPYAISEPFSTAGKINMNYQILPFKHIIRQTGLYSVLKAEKIMAIPNTDAGNANNAVVSPSAAGQARGYKTFGIIKSYRHSIDAEQTLRQFDENYFDNGKIFVSASEICDQYLVPKGKTLEEMPSYWRDYLLTGDNAKERPYANIYPRLTTKSNTYRVHYRVQTLKKVKGTPANVFVDPDTSDNSLKDQVLSENRGSYIVERYLEYNDPRFGVSIDPMNESLNKAYKFRIVGSKQFNP